MKNKSLLLFTFLTSTSTLFCCALPALFVTLGFGSTFASIISNIPQLIWLSENKMIVFGISASLLVVGGYFQWLSATAPCPIDPQLRQLCLTSRKWGLRVYICSVILFCVGFSFAFLLA